MDQKPPGFQPKHRPRQRCKQAKYGERGDGDFINRGLRGWEIAQKVTTMGKRKK